MCTLIVAWRVFPETPVCVGANRDEARDRPATPPVVRGGNPQVLAPRDERAGGTWIGYNEHGVLVAITNRWVEGTGERSRGLLVDDALGESTAAAARERIEIELEARAYAPFYLVAVDDRDCFIVENGSGNGDTAPDKTRDFEKGGDGEGTRADRSSPLEGHRVHVLDPGVHVVVNVGFDGEWFVPATRPQAGRQQAANAERVRSELQPHNGESAADWTRRAGEVLSNHDFGLCSHTNGFGTRSSSLIRIGNERSFLHANGPPCETAYVAIDETL